MAPAIPEAVQLIDAQILHHLALVQDLKLQRNALLPISQLPPEILGKIFHKVRGRHIHGVGKNGYFWTPHCFEEPCLKWIAISQVSRYWRSVAIADASLWTRPPLKNLKLTRMMLNRSRRATIPAITLKVDELDKRVMAALKPHIPRVSAVVIPNMARETLEQVLTSLPSTAPQLRALSINSLIKVTLRNCTSARRSVSPEFDEALVLPDNILCHTPKLRWLQLSNVTLKSGFPLLSRLTNLSMSGIPEKSKPTPHEFRSMLASAPYLKWLELIGICPQQPMVEPVLMEHLQYLHIDETIPRLISFFTKFSVTHSLKGLNIRVNYVEGSAEDLSLLFDALNQPYIYSVIGTSTDVRSLQIGQPDGIVSIRALKLSPLERNLEPDKRDSKFDNSNSLCIRIQTDVEVMEDFEEDLMTETTDMIISDLFYNFSWTGLSELDLGYLDYASPHALASTFGTIPQLRVIAIVAQDSTKSWFINSLDYHSQAQSNPSDALSLDFAGVQHIYIDDTDLTRGNPNFKALHQYVQRRHKCGSPIISLKFTHSRSAKEVVILLKKYVKHVIFRPAKSDHKVVDNYSPYDYDWYI